VHSVNSKASDASLFGVPIKAVTKIPKSPPGAHVARSTSGVSKLNNDFSSARIPFPDTGRILWNRPPPQIQARMTIIAAAIDTYVCTLIDLMERIYISNFLDV
jgi:hypothetical protein